MKCAISGLSAVFRSPPQPRLRFHTRPLAVAGLLALAGLFASNPASAQTPPAPSISVAGGDYPHEIKVSWTWSAGDSGCSVDDYYVEYKKSSEATWNTSVLDYGANDADSGIYSFLSSLGSSTSISASFTIGPRAKGSYSGEGGATLADVNYDVRLYAYSENCSDWTPNSNVATGKPTQDVKPAFANNASIANLTLLQDFAMTPVTLPAATGGNRGVYYSLSPDLPAGLSAKQSTRVLSGTPTETQSATTYTYKAHDTDYNTADGDAATLPTFTIAVVVDTAPAFADDAAIANLSLIRNTAMEVTLPAATGGNGTLSYTLSPTTLPAGLTFTAGTRVLSGTPTGTSASTTYTYTVSDDDNNTASTDADKLTFTIAVDATDIAPTVSFNPANGSTTTDASGDITLAFSEAVYKDSSQTEFGVSDLDTLIELKVKDDNGASIAFTPSINKVNTVVTVNPTADLSDGDVYIEVGSGFYDTAGNQGSSDNATFTVDTIAPTVTEESSGYYQEAALSNVLTGPVKVNTNIYIKVTFSENVGHVVSDLAAARPEVFYKVGDATETQFHIVAVSATLASGECQPTHATNRNVYKCLYTPTSSDSGDFDFHVGTNTKDIATNALEDKYTHTAKIRIDTTVPTVTADSSGYYEEAALTTVLTGPVQANKDIYVKVTFSENVGHFVSNGASARPALLYKIGAAPEQQFHIVADTATLASGDCQPDAAPPADVYVCLYRTPTHGDSGDFNFHVGTATTDRAGNALKDKYTHTAKIVIDIPAPPPPPPPSPPSSGGGGGGGGPTPPTPTQGSLENPGPGSAQSGIGLLSGWVCDADQVTLVLNPGTPTAQTLAAAYGTDRADTTSVCGDRNNGFGLLLNWNLLGDGTHTLVARADGEVFGRATVTVTTLGEEFVREAEGECTVADFPDTGETTRLVWQEAQQNFVIAAGSRPTGPAQAGTEGVGRLENPGVNSFQSGIGLISGWVCDATRVAVRLNNGPAIPAAYGTARADTESVCGDTNNGFGLLFNWNLLGDGEHAVEAVADRVVFGRTRVRVTTLGEEFVRGAAGRCSVEAFPSASESVTLEWQQSRQNFVITDVQ